MTGCPSGNRRSRRDDPGRMSSKPIQSFPLDPRESLDGSWSCPRGDQAGRAKSEALALAGLGVSGLGNEGAGSGCGGSGHPRAWVGSRS